MKIQFLQTCDPDIYIKLLMITSKTVFNYCARWHMDYECFVGLKRGSKPWHAALNRILMLRSLIATDFQGWVIYMDADAYIVNMDFDLRQFLEGKHDFAMIAAPSGMQPPNWWDINNGVFALNLSHEVGRTIVEKWHAKLLEVSEDMLNSETRWGEVIDDQTFLHAVFQENEDMERFLYLDAGENAVFNWHASFVRQIIRAWVSFDDRYWRLKNAVSNVLGEYEGRAIEREVFAQVVSAIYQVFLGRPADEIGFAHALENMTLGHRTVEQEMRACLKSSEFKANLDHFLETMVGP